MTDSIIELTNLSKTFFTEEVETLALAEVHLKIRKGEFVSISGPSGCGKSTLLSVIGLLDGATDGQYLLNGQDVSEIDKKTRAKIRNREIGFVFQAFNLISDLTVYENVEVPLTYRADISKFQRRQLVEDALAKVDMSHRARHFPSQLSGGQQQRVAIARALSGSPSLLLADEPTGNLDSSNAQIVMDLLHKLHKGGATICMVTHDQRNADSTDRKIILFDGRVVEDEIANAA